MAATALISITLTPLLYGLADPAEASDQFGSFLSSTVIDSSLMTASVLAGSFLSGAVYWHPPERRDDEMEKIRLIMTMIGLAFWLPGLIFAIGLWLDPTVRFDDWRWAALLAHPFFFAALGAICGSMIYGPIAYLTGTAILWPLRQLEIRRDAIAPARLPPPVTFNFVVGRFSGALCMITAGLCLWGFAALSWALISAGLIYSETLF